MDIKEMAKKMTRSEFMNWYEDVVECNECPSYFGLDDDRACEKFIGNCVDCMEEAIKNIKFKDDIEKPKTWAQKFYEEKGQEIVKEIVNEVLGDDKMEDKTIKVRCINTFFDNLTIGKEYPVIDDAINGYAIKGDDDKIHIYPKEIFEKVEDVLMVECINRYGFGNELTLNKKYEVLGEGKEWYRIRNDLGKEFHYEKDLFKPVEPQKETKSYMIDVNGKEARVSKGKFIKEYTLMEVLEMPKGTILKLFPYDESERRIIVAEGVNKNKYLYYIDDEGCHEEGVMISNWIMDKPRFIKVEEPKPVNAAEAFKALDEGKIIESLYSHNRYFKDGNEIVEYDLEEKSITFEELENQWIIEKL